MYEIQIKLSVSSLDNMATVLWVWDMQKMSLEAALQHTAPVRSFQWDPKRPRLALCTGNSKLYLWSPAGSVSVQVPSEGEGRERGGGPPGSRDPGGSCW